MGNSRSLGAFVNFGVQEALSLAENSPDSWEFSERMVKSFSSYLDLPGESVKKLYNPFHWYFFCGAGHFFFNGNSPIQYRGRGSSLAQIIGKGKIEPKGDIILRRKVTRSEISQMAMDILTEYGEYFRSNISLQEY